VSPQITAIVAGPTATHYGAISEDGELYLWGRNERGQLGNGGTKNVYVPTR
jgi:alpha-tubulin suppressor-like RCC1 family protein